ncbi:MAG: copper chaperone PCu(A)C [Novosphingobium sp.]|uniref:copper chaperone PCu(A)C n=1 Tax=Novosphingobium sp. TaxID=1874826 RepID=UPI0032B726F8
MTSPLPSHRTAAVSIALALGALTLAGCKQEAKPQAEATDAPAVEAKPGTTVSEARLVLPAVKGSPGAAYFAVANGSSGTIAIAAVSIDGAAKAEMHQTVGGSMTPVERIDIAPGTAIAFEPGALHVMAYDLADKLKAGSTTEMTITFADGDKVSAPVKIESRGEAAMGGMDHGDGH